MDYEKVHEPDRNPREFIVLSLDPDNQMISVNLSDAWVVAFKRAGKDVEVTSFLCDLLHRALVDAFAKARVSDNAELGN